MQVNSLRLRPQAVGGAALVSSVTVRRNRVGRAARRVVDGASEPADL